MRAIPALRGTGGVLYCRLQAVLGVVTAFIEAVSERSVQQSLLFDIRIANAYAPFSDRLKP